MSNEEKQSVKNPKGQGIIKSKPSRFDQNDLLERGKIPPQAVDLEEVVLGAIMIDKDALVQVVDMLNADVFYSQKHQTIYAAINQLFKDGNVIDLLTVTQQLRKTGELETVGGAYYLSQLTSRVASTAHLEYHARILLEKYMLRELIKTSSHIITESYKTSTDVFNLLDEAESNLFSISEKNFHREYSGMEKLVEEAIGEIKAAKEHGGNLSGIPSGFKDLDRVTSGWQKSDLVILAARPGMGKTAFVLSMARNMAVEHEVPLAIFSLEMSAVQLTTRLISSETEISADKLKKGSLEDYEWDALNKRIKRLIKAPIFIDDTPALSIFELRAKARRLKSQHDIKMIIIDYIQLMSGGGDKAGNREQEISTISRSLKGLAKELNIPIITLSQLNRSVETRGGTKRPLLSDLRESGAIEQDADLVMFIYRPEYYQLEYFDDKQEFPAKGIAEIIIAKHRNGPLENVFLRFKGTHAKFMDYMKNEELGSNAVYESYSEGMPQNTMVVRSRMDEVAASADDAAQLTPEDETPF
jgi:replicative DNA helicase